MLLHGWPYTVKVSYKRTNIVQFYLYEVLDGSGLVAKPCATLATTRTRGLPFPSATYEVLQFSSVQFSRSVMFDSLRPHESQHARPPCPSPTPGVHSKLTSIESVMPSSHLIFCHPLFLLSLIPPSIRVFSNESTLRMRWPKYWSFSFSIIPSKEHPGLISFRMDWLDEYLE